MPYNRPIPDPKQSGKDPGLFSAWIQAEKLMQIALVLPCAAFIGWLIGAWLDHTFTNRGSRLWESCSAASPGWSTRFAWRSPPTKIPNCRTTTAIRRTAERQRRIGRMTDEALTPLVALTDDGLQALLKRAIRITLIVGALASLVLWKASGWRDAAMLATGAAISAASIHEWRRLIRFINAKMDHQQAPQWRSGLGGPFCAPAGLFGAAIYGSLKCFRGSVVALLCGLGLAVLAMVWEAVRLLRD